VIAAHHPKWDERPLLIVVLKEGASLTREDLLTWLAPRLAKWWLPDDFIFIDALPKTSVGKFDKKMLRQQFDDYAAQGQKA
jgi:fatty-acyl-CoA synthase